MKTKQWLLFALILLAFLFLDFTDALAQATDAVENNSLDQITDLFKENAKHWEDELRRFALRVFWLLAVIDLILMGSRLLFRGSDLSEWASEIVNQILFLGFFGGLLFHSSEWAEQIVNSFTAAGASATREAGGIAAIKPSVVFDVGLNLGLDMMASVGIGFQSIIMFFSALVIIVAFGLIAAFMIVAIVEAHVVISAGVLFMGFGGSRLTKNYALKMLTYAVSVGAKLFVIQLMVGLGQTMIQSWEREFSDNNADVFVVVGLSIVFVALVKMIPGIVQGLISGASLGQGATLVGATMDAGRGAKSVFSGAKNGLAKAGASTLGVGAAILAAKALARQSRGEPPKAPGTARRAIGKAASQATSWMEGRALGNLALSAGADAKNRAKSRVSGAVGRTLGGRMAQSMNEKATRMREEKDSKASTSPLGGRASRNTIGGQDAGKKEAASGHRAADWSPKSTATEPRKGSNSGPELPQKVEELAQKVEAGAALADRERGAGGGGQERSSQEALRAMVREWHQQNFPQGEKS